MKKSLAYIIPLCIVVAFAFYLVFSKSTPSATAPGSGNSVPAGSTTTNPAQPSTDTAAGSGAGVSVGIGVNSSTTGQYKNGTYTGSVEDAIYGKLQVVATIQGGNITNLTWPVYPDNGGHTLQVSQSALPQLEQEAISSQSANVNVVSGATQTSEAFQASLASALAQAKS